MLFVHLAAAASVCQPTVIVYVIERVAQTTVTIALRQPSVSHRSFLPAPLSGKKKVALKRKLHEAEMNLAPNMDFVAERFDEHMEHTTERAKSEVNAYAQHLLGDMARMALTGGEGDKPLLLEAPDEDEDERDS